MVEHSLPARKKGLGRRAKRRRSGNAIENKYLLFPQPHTNNLICTQGERAAGIGFVLVARREFTHAKTQKKTNNNFVVTRLENFVRIKGLEPPRLSASDPKSDVATNYTISASLGVANI